jgi:hypothetical protein
VVLSGLVVVRSYKIWGGMYGMAGMSPSLLAVCIACSLLVMMWQMGEGRGCHDVSLTLRKPPD